MYELSWIGSLAERTQTDPPRNPVPSCLGGYPVYQSILRILSTYYFTAGLMDPVLARQHQEFEFPNGLGTNKCNFVPV